MIITWLQWLRWWIGLKGTTPTKPIADGFQARLLSLHNAERTKRGLLPLRRDPLLESVAKKWAEQMARSTFLSHDDFGGRIRAEGYNWRRCAENAAYGQASADAVMQTWMGSPGHRDNILGLFSDVGFGSAIDSRGRRWWCADFGSRV